MKLLAGIIAGAALPAIVLGLYYIYGGRNMFNEMNGNKKTVREGIDTRSMDFAPLKDFCGREFVVDGYFFTNGRYGEQVVVVGAGTLINFPNRATKVFKSIDSDPQKVNAVLNGHLKITGIKIGQTRNGSTVFYTLADC